MGCFSKMLVYCPICKQQMDGMLSYGREAHCCGKDCYEEWEWRRTLAILGKDYIFKHAIPTIVPNSVHEYVPVGHYTVEGADGVRYVKKEGKQNMDPTSALGVDKTTTATAGTSTTPISSTKE